MCFTRVQPEKGKSCPPEFSYKPYWRCLGFTHKKNTFILSMLRPLFLIVLFICKVTLVHCLIQNILC